MLVEDVSSVLPMMQAEAEAMMIETVRIDRVLGTDTADDAEVTEELLDPPVYLGKGKVNSYQPYEQERNVSGSQDVTQRYSVHIPVSVAGVAVGDIVTVTAGPSAGRVLRVAGTHRKTFPTAQRLLCDERTGGGLHE